MTLTDTTAVRQNPRTAWRPVEGEALLVAIDSRQLHRLNGVAGRIWELADGRTVAQIAATVEAEYAVDQATALSDTRAFLEKLHSLGVLEVARG